MLVPCQAVSLLSVTQQSHIRSDLVILRSAGMLGIIKNMNFSVVNCLGGDDLRVLRHVAGSVDLTLVVDLNVNLDSSLLVCGRVIATKPVSLVIQHVLLEISGVFGRLLW